MEYDKMRWVLTWATGRTMLLFTEMEMAVRKAGWGEAWYQKFSSEYVKIESLIRQLIGCLAYICGGLTKRSVNVHLGIISVQAAFKAIRLAENKK